MMYAFVSGVAFSVFLIWIWSLCRAGADADKLAERIYHNTKDEPC